MKKGIAVFMILVGLVCLGSGCYLTFMSDTNDSKTGSEKSSSGTGNVEQVSINEADIKEYASYNNYKLDMNVTMTSENITLNTSTVSDIDIQSKIISATLTAMGSDQYLYYDLNNGLEYYSSDNTTWKKNNNKNMQLPDFNNIINRVKTLDNVNKDGNNTYSYVGSVKTETGIVDNIPITVSFTTDGYLSRVSYDLASTDSSMTTYLITYTFSNVNQLESLSIPANVSSGAAKGTESTTISFLS